ncbi:MAG: ABC transporter ATP-binding protein [Anaerolineales bacterium]
MADIELEEDEYTSQITGKTLRRILGLTKPYRRWVIGFWIMIAFTSILDAVFTYLNKGIIDQGIVAHNRQALIQIISLYGGLILIQAGCVFTFIFLAGVLGERIQYDLRKVMFNHLQELSLAYYSQTSVGRLMARVTSDSGRVSDLVTWGLVDSTWAVMNITTSTIFMMIINWKLALIVLVTIPILLAIAIQFRKRILVEFRKSRRANSRITGAYNENISGVRVVKALGRENENLNEFKVLTNEMYRASYHAAWLSALFLPTVQIVSALALGFIVWYGGLQANVGIMTIGGIQAFVSYLTFMMWPIQDLARVYAEMQHSIASAERIFTLLDAVPEVSDRTGSVDPGTIRGTIEFDHVDFTYEDGKPVLTDFSLKVELGEMIALVGPTGGGKTTIVNLLCRFYEPKRGVIRINRRDYTEFTLHGIQSRVGIVLQTPHLFSGSIRENIRYGCLNATDADVEEASKLAGAHDFIVNFVKKYDQEVGEGGNLLSVGQKQLVSIARAILADPDIFIMDEATSSVDTLTEALIQRGMENLMKGRTSFIIAHRLSTIKRANRIIVVEDGRITEMGTHSELLRARGHYYRLYTQQFRQEQEQEFNPFLSQHAVSPAD